MGIISYTSGNLLESSAHVLVNTVNTVGVMGKGIALQFKNEFPKNYKSYQKACKEGVLQIGKLWIEKDTSLLYGTKIIVNFPTKTAWQKPSEYAYIEAGLIALRDFIISNQIQSIAIPPLGAGNGGLLWDKVKTLIVQYLSNLPCQIVVYEPNEAIKEGLKKEKVPLTPVRAMLLAILYDLVANGEFVSEFAAEKICYFLQRFGASDILKLDFKANFYGPYSGKVRHILYYLNGSYLRGFSSKDKKPFDELDLLTDSQKEVLAYLSAYENESRIVEKTKFFLRGYYNNFGLELLSTLDFIVHQEQSFDKNLIKKRLSEWGERKTKLFMNDAFLEKGLKKVEQIKQTA